MGWKSEHPRQLHAKNSLAPFSDILKILQTTDVAYIGTHLTTKPGGLREHAVAQWPGYARRAGGKPRSRRHSP